MGATGCPTPSKKGYKTVRAAKQHMWGLLKMNPADRRKWRKLHIYQCGCGMFHVGHR